MHYKLQPKMLVNIKMYVSYKAHDRRSRGLKKKLQILA